MKQSAYSSSAVLLCVLYTVLGVIGFMGAAFAGTPPCPPRTFTYLRYDEDYQFLARPECRTDPLDVLKYIPLGDRGRDWFVSLAGEVRQNVEYFSNANWGQGPQGPAYLLQRYMFHSDFHLGSRVRLFVQVKSGLEDGRAGGPRPIDEDKFAFHQGSVGLVLHASEQHPVLLRVGRQELAFGARRYLSAREGPNVRQTFDGFRLDFMPGQWKLTALATKPVETNPGFFDDAPTPGQGFWGAYATRPLQREGAVTVDLYYFGLHRTQAQYQQGKASELRQSLGTRFWGRRRGWDYDNEGIFQFGSFGSGNIHAWSVETENGYSFRSVPLEPRLALRSNIASGDRDSRCPNLQTFYPLFPRGLYHQLVNLNGHVNFADLDPVFVTHLTQKLSLTFDWDFFWRQSRGDGIYGVGGNFRRGSLGSSARYIGSQPTLVATWEAQRHLSVVVIYTHFFSGPFLQQTGPSKNVDYLSGWVDFKF
jgi:hypothetical protein